ncbi:MAG TPA: DNA-processing protein DprA [Burkholderiaceae bacterium]
MPGGAIDAAELGAWLRLTETPKLGREAARKLLAAFGSAEAVIAASTGARREVAGPGQTEGLATEPDSLAALLNATLAWLGADAPEARAVITLGDERYPAALLTTADPPLLLYAQGRLELLQAESIAIVGSRNPTPQGHENAHAFASHLSHAGLTVVSGLAIGIDAAAHGGGLEGAASTIAVVGTGLDQVYPKRNQSLRQRIAINGLIVSEYSLGMPPLAVNFPRRNRIIAGLAQGTLVVEAAVQSGSLITARMANESGREVFAIPGSIHSPQARGCHALIKQGAKLVETANDILEELRRPTGASAGAKTPQSAPEGGDSVLAALGFDPVTLDALVARTGGTAAELSVRLLDLEMDGKVSRLPGQLFQRVARG